MTAAAFHRRVTRLGDQLATVGQWVVTVVFMVAAAGSAAVLGFVSFLALLDMIGRF